jgi:tetratricopeptide (TPR) repeat protein
MGGMYFNYANALARFGRVEQAISNFLQAAKIEPDFHLPYANLGNIYWQRAAVDPIEFEKSNLMQASNYFAKAKKNIELSAKTHLSEAGLGANNDYQGILRMIKKVSAEMTISRTEVDAQRKAAASGNRDELLKFAQLLEKRNDFQQAASIYDQLIAGSPGEFNLYYNKYQCLMQNSFFDGIKQLEVLLQNWPKFHGVGPDVKLQIIEGLGMQNLQVGRYFLSQQNVQASLEPFEKSRDYLDQFKSEAAPYMQNADLRRRVIQSERARQEAAQRVEQIKAFLRQSEI